MRHNYLFFEKEQAIFRNKSFINHFGDFIEQLIDLENEHLHPLDLDDHDFFLNPNKIQNTLLYDFIQNHQNYYEDYKILYLMLFYLLQPSENQFANYRFIIFLKNYNQDKKLTQSEFVKNIFNKLAIPEENEIDASNLDETLSKLLLVCYFYNITLEKVYFNYLGLVDDNILDNLCNQGLVLSRLLHRRMNRAFQAILPLHDHAYLSLSLNYPIYDEYLEKKKDYIHLKSYRLYYDFMNLGRLFVFRLRRLILNANDFFKQNNMSHVVLFCEPIVRRFLQWFNFLFFIPRILLHFSCAAQHVFTPDKSEEKIPWQVRLNAQMSRRWEIMLRDVIWFSNSLLSLFILTGVLSFGAFYLNVFFQFVEVLLNCYIWSSLNIGLQDRKNFVENFEEFLDGDESLDLCLKDISERATIQMNMMRNRFYLSVGVLVSNILILPIMGIYSAAIPLLGALVGIMMSCLQFYNRSLMNADNEKLRKKTYFDFYVKYNQLTPKLNIDNPTPIGYSNANFVAT